MDKICYMIKKQDYLYNGEVKRKPLSMQITIKLIKIPTNDLKANVTQTKQ